jgi:hypothetical protein
LLFLMNATILQMSSSARIVARGFVLVSMSDLYREKVTDLCHALELDEASRVGARERIRGLIDEISLEPQGDHLGIVLKGNLAGMCGWPKTTRGRRKPTTSWTKIQLVAEACNQR